MDRRRWIAWDTVHRMLQPDDKDWTWVLDRPCLECGFDAHACPAQAVPGLIRENVTAWTQMLANGAIRPGRPDAVTWSSLEYACHVRDVYERYRSRVALMLEEDDPLFPNWDQDASAVEDRYEAQDPARVIEELGSAGERLAVQLEQLADAEWERPGRRSDGASFTVATIARYMVHDPIHHVWDVSKNLT